MKTADFIELSRVKVFIDMTEPSQFAATHAKPL